MNNNFFKDLYKVIKEKNDEKLKKENNKKDKQKGNFYKNFRQDFSKEVRYSKIEDLQNKLSDEYKYMIQLSKSPNRLSINDLLKEAPPDIAANELFENYGENVLKNLKIKQAGFSFLTPCLIKKEYKNNFEKLIGHIEKYIEKKIEFSKFSLNDVDKLSNFVKSKLKYKEDKKEIEKLEEPFQDAIKSIKGLIYALKERDNLKLKENFKLKFDELTKSFSNFVGSSVIGSSFQKSFKQLIKGEADLLALYQVKDFQKNFNNDKGHEKLVLFMINLIQDASNILSNVYDIIIKISNDNKIQKQNEYYKCAKQLNEIKNQIIQKMNDDYNKVDNNKKTAFIFICANLKLEYQYLIEKDKSERGKIDTTKFESDSISEIFSNFIDEDPLIKKLSTGIKMKFNPKTTEKYDYIPHKKPLFLPKLIFFNGEPNISDIKQGDIGDCYLLAALQNLVGNSQGKEAIEKVFLNKDTAGKDEYVKMRFFKLQFKKKDGLTCIEPSGEKTIIKINKELLVKNIDQKIEEKNKAYNETVGSCWVDCFEKAFAVYRHDKTNIVVDEKCKEEDKKELENLVDSWNSELSLKLSSANINGGWSMIPLAAITGNPYFTFNNDAKKDENEMYNFFKDNTSNKVISFKEDEIKKISNIGNHLYSTHAYSVLEVCEKNNTITLRNPHNGDGIDLSEALLYNSNSKNIEFNSKKVFINEKNKTKIEKGTVTMRFDVFCKLLNDVEFG